jgi:rhamnosyltransferase
MHPGTTIVVVKLTLLGGFPSAKEVIEIMGLKAIKGVSAALSYQVVVPALNAEGEWPQLVSSLKTIDPECVLIIDSSSSDRTAELARSSGFRVHTISRDEFNHGGTRQLALAIVPDAEFFIYLTQDVTASGDSISSLLEAFSDPQVAVAYGRQLPRTNAMPIESHARLFNYRPLSEAKTLDDRKRLGFKSIFISNSFAAYRRKALEEVGGFPGDVIFGEDTVTAAKLLLAGWKIAYVAEAQVYHSHSYTWRQEFRRYFDIGVLHSREAQLLQQFGGAGGEGMRFVKSELRYLWPKHWYLIPSALIRTLLKFIGYRMGRMESYLSIGWKRRLSMNRQFWR